MAMTFGLIVQDRALRNLGIRNASIGFILAILFGMVYGLIVLNFADEYNHNTEWPTSFMQARGLTRTLWKGVLAALPSGAAVALSILSGNQASLVGVAISASLLPPCVNTVGGRHKCQFLCLIINFSGTFVGLSAYTSNKIVRRKLYTI